MALQSRTTAVGNLQDDTSGNNYAVNKAVYVLKLDKTLAQIYSDVDSNFNGTTPITQDGVNNVTNSRGEFTYWVEAGDYIERVGANERRVSITGADYFNNRIEETENAIIDAVAGRGAYYVVGQFENGFTYTDINQTGTYDNGGNLEYYVYTGGLSSLPHTVTSGTNPTNNSDYARVNYNSSSDVINDDGTTAQYTYDLTVKTSYFTAEENDISSNIVNGETIRTKEGYTANASVPSGTDLRVFQGAGELELSIYNNLAPSDEARAITSTFKPSNEPSIYNVMDKIHAGEAVKIACFGDSTTAGVATTGYTANNTDSGQAYGLVDETLNSPNAYPALMRPILFGMYDNSLLRVYNNGYSGQSVANGWALRNYASAIVNNPAIGHPDICLIQFGLNDVNLGSYDIKTFIDETEKLIYLQKGFGTLPVLVSSNPSSTGAGGNRDNKLMETLDAAKKELAVKWGIPFLDHHSEIKYFMANNREWRDSTNNYRWARIQNDGTHTNDYGHQFKASFFSAMLYSGTVFLDGQQEYVATWDSRANTIADFDDNEGGTNPKNTRLHKNAVINSCPASTNLMRVYVWNRGLNAACIYRGIGNEGYAGAGGTPPRAIIEKLSTLKSQDSYVVQSSFETTEHSYSSSDVPHYVGGLSFGLNLVRYTSGSVAGYNSHFGSFEFVSDFNLSDSRRVISGFRFKDTVQSALNAKELPFMSNLVSIPSATNKALRMHIDARVPQGSGVVLWWAQAFDGTAASWTYDRKILVTLYRNTSNQIVIKLIKWANNGYQGEQVLLTSSTLTQTDDDIKLLVVINRSATGQRWRVFEDDVLDPPWVLDSTILFSDIMAPWAGICGGAYNNDANLREVHIKSIDAWYA